MATSMIFQVFTVASMSNILENKFSIVNSKSISVPAIKTSKSLFKNPTRKRSKRDWPTGSDSYNLDGSALQLLVCCWFSSLLREVFLRVLRFSPLLNNQHFQIPIDSEKPREGRAN